MSSEYFLNGVDLDQPGRWRVMQGTLLPAVAAPRLHSTEVPIRSGILDGAGERVGTFKVTVAFMVEGADRAGLDRNWQALMAFLRASSRLTALQHRPAGASPKEALVRLVSVSQPSWRYGEWAIDTTVIFEAVEGVWKDVSPVEAPLTDLSALAGARHPYPMLSCACRPLLTRPPILDVTSDTSLTWRGVAAAGQHLLVDVASYSAWRQESDGWEPAQGAVDASP